MNPWIIIGVILAMLGFYGYGHHKGWNDRDLEMQAEISKKNDEARTKEQELNKQINEQSYKLQEANNAITEKQSSLDRAIRAGKLRLNTKSCVQTNPSTPSPSGDRDTEGSESDRATLLAIAEIVAQGDRNTAQLNQCIQAYEAVRSQINAQR